jgi:hypothetical protein
MPALAGTAALPFYEKSILKRDPRMEAMVAAEEAFTYKPWRA